MPNSDPETAAEDFLDAWSCSDELIRAVNNLSQAAPGVSEIHVGLALMRAWDRYSQADKLRFVIEAAVPDPGKLALGFADNGPDVPPPARAEVTGPGRTPVSPSPPVPDDRQAAWQAAITDPDVWNRLCFYSTRIGGVPPAKFLLALLIEWDMADAEGRRDALVEAMGIDVDKLGEDYRREPFVTDATSDDGPVE